MGHHVSEFQSSSLILTLFVYGFLLLSLFYLALHSSSPPLVLSRSLSDFDDRIIEILMVQSLAEAQESMSAILSWSFFYSLLLYALLRPLISTSDLFICSL